MSSTQNVKITLHFSVEDAALLRRMAEFVITSYGLGHEFDPNNLADCVAELLLHSNPGVLSYDRYGIELTQTELENS